MAADEIRLAHIHDADFEDRVHALMARDTEALAQRASEMFESDCPACSSASVENAFVLRGLHHRRCMKCGTLFLSPCPTETLILEFLTQGEGARVWREEMPESLRRSRQPMHRRRLKHALQVARDQAVVPETIMEIGGGGGDFAREAATEDVIKRLIVVEPQPLSLDLPKVEVVSGSFATVDLGGAADMLVAFEVFEHLVKPDDFLAMTHRSVRKGGLVHLTTPNANGFEISVLKQRSDSVPFDHVRIYTPTAMQLMLERAGFEVVEISTPGALDVQIVHRAYKSGILDLSRDPALEFLLAEIYEHRQAFQSFLQRRLLSSHMRCTARRL